MEKNPDDVAVTVPVAMAAEYYKTFAGCLSDLRLLSNPSQELARKAYTHFAELPDWLAKDVHRLSEYLTDVSVAWQEFRRYQTLTRSERATAYQKRRDSLVSLMHAVGLYQIDIYAQLLFSRIAKTDAETLPESVDRKFLLTTLELAGQQWEQQRQDLATAVKTLNDMIDTMDQDRNTWRKSQPV